VWGTEITNDTFAPLRALRWPRTGKDRSAARPRLGATGRMGPPEAAGRWSLVSEAVAVSVAIAGRAPSETERRHALATGLLERHGIVTRDSVAAENVPGGFGAVYPILREMEERGRVRRGYFVEGLGGAQFALPGAVDRLRAERSDPSGDRASVPLALLLAATDPANPYGASLPWPRFGDDDRRVLARAAGAYVVLVDGEAALYLDRGGKSLQTLPAFGADATVADSALRALAGLVADGRLRSLQIERIDGTAVNESPVRDRLVAAGFRAGYRGLSLAPAGR
jgi:ATP-dependent helicase Lhr and Lhr-like helicase